ncbi:plasmid mobilization relaxosome protein MobC [Enterococcus mundtii]|nr:plasmid mobilization relaxosome protein MobC [Enterococcus mundtii]
MLGSGRNMRKKELFRSEFVQVYLTKEEKKRIKENMETSGLKTMTNYVRIMALNGLVVKIDFTTLRESLAETGQYVSELNMIGNNINQIAHKLNQTDIVETEDIQYLVSEFAKMQNNYVRSQDILLQEIQKLTRSE